jgi:HAD superfamily hydrolase (TIGR01549 family)
VTQTHWLCDLDGTLYRPGPVQRAMALELLARGLFGPLRSVRAFRRAHEALRERFRSDPDYRPADPFRAQLELASAASGIPPERLADHVQRWMFERPQRHLARALRHDLLAELEAFAAAGGRLALVSDYPAAGKLRAMGLERRFEVVVASGEPGGPRRLKPDPEGYLLAAAALGAEPGDCLVIGDRDDADGAAARAAGMAFRRID